MLNTRFGAEPVVDVKIPWPALVKSRSSQCGAITSLPATYGRQVLENAVSALENCRLPLETAFTEVKLVP